VRTSSLHVAQVAAIGTRSSKDRLAAPCAEVKYVIRWPEYCSNLRKKYDDAIDMAEAADVGLW